MKVSDGRHEVPAMKVKRIGYNGRNFNNKTLTPNPKSGCNGNAFPTKLTLSGPCPVNCRMRDNGCGLHDDGKF